MLARRRPGTLFYAALAAWLIALASALGSSHGAGGREQQAGDGHIAYELFARDASGVLSASWIAYSSLHRAERRLLTARPQPGEQRIDSDPVWSPNGKRLAFIRTWRRSTFVEVYVVNADGTGLHRLLRGPKHGADDFTLLWKPDGTALLFARQLGYSGRGTVPTRLPFDLLDVSSGRRTARYAAVRDARKMSLFLAPLAISPDGSELLYIVDRCSNCGEPSFESNLLGVSHLRTLASRVIAETGTDIATWAPSGRRVAYLNGGDLTVVSLSRRRAYRVDLGGVDIGSGDDPSNLLGPRVGNEIFLGGRTLRALDLATGRVRTVARVVRGQASDFLFVPILAADAGGKHLAAGHDSGRAYTVNVVASQGRIVSRQRLSPPSRHAHIGDVSATFDGMLGEERQAQQ